MLNFRADILVGNVRDDKHILFDIFMYIPPHNASTRQNAEEHDDEVSGDNY
jgi:hypothetical protein